MSSPSPLVLAFVAFAPDIKVLPEAEYLVETTVRVSSTGGGTIQGAVPIPREWPEQRIEAVAPETTRCKAKVEPVPPGGAYLSFTTQKLRPGEWATLAYKQRVFVKPRPRRKREVYPTAPPLDARIKQYTLPTPTIDCRDPAIRRKAAEICEGADAAWEKAQRLADWTAKHLEYKLMAYTSAKEAFETKVGDCEELSALFVALCRSQGIPARTVMSPGKTQKDTGHCWAEILLADKNGETEWLPIDVQMRWFAELPVAPMIIQKGENYPRLIGGGGRQRVLRSWARGVNGSLTMEFEQNVTPISKNAILDPTTVKSPGESPKS
jgi:hypothetical protein